MTGTVRLALSVLILGAALAGPAGAGWLDSVKGAVEGAKEALGPPARDGSSVPLGSDEIARGLREALAVAAKKAVSEASAKNGFLGNPEIRIPLPGKLQAVGDLLEKIGFGAQVTAFEETMNRAAEKASARALPIFADAVSKLTFEDVHRIWKGGDTAATDYLRENTREPLYREFRPVVHEAAQSVGVTRSYEELTSLPQVSALLSGGQLDLDHYVTNKTLDGVFALMADEETQIRTNPVARTTDLLKRVFSR